MQVCYIQQKYQVYYQVNTFDNYFKKYIYSNSDPPPPRVSNAYASVDTLPTVRTYFMDDPKDIHPCVIEISSIYIYIYIYIYI